MDIWHVLKKHGFSYCNYHLEQLITDQYLDCRVLKKLPSEAWHFNMSVIHYTVLSIHGKLLFPFANFETSQKKKKNVSARSEKYIITTFNPNLGGWFRGLFWGGWGKITPCLKLVRTMLETLNLARKYACIFSFRKYTF